MNGDNQIILDAVKNNGKDISKIYTKIEGMEITQTLQHKQNKDSIAELKSHVKGYGNLKGQVIAQWIIISGVFISIITLFIKSL